MPSVARNFSTTDDGVGDAVESTISAVPVL